MKNRTMVCRLGKFPQLTRTVFTAADGLSSDTTTALCFGLDGALYVGTDKGLSKIVGEKISAVDIGIKNAPVSMLFCSNNGHLFVGTGKKLLEFNGKKLVAQREFSSDTVSMKQDSDGVTWLLTKTVLYRFPDMAKDFDLQIGVPGRGSCIAVAGDNKVYVGTEGEGLHALVGKRWHWSELMENITGILSDCITCLDIDPAGNIWIGTDKGVCVYDDNSYWLDHSNISGLPTGKITGMATSDDGKRYFTTEQGLIIQHNGKLSYYGYKRWLPNMHATDIVLSPDGSFCVSTKAGISVFKTEWITLEEKAKRLRAITEKYNVRKDGYVLSRTLEHEGVVSEDEGYITSSDNDGLWTGIYLGALAFEYACTKDEKVRADAHRSLLAMIKLTKVSGIEGFTARALRYPDEVDFGTGARHEWHAAVDKDGNELEWLGETSSDEMVGHFYAYSNYFDLVADDEEKKLIADTVRKILDHILSHKFRLVDTDGKPTTWANWDPDLLNHDHKWVYEKGTNSLQILTFLKAGYHITGDERYQKMFDYLAGDKHFAMNLMQYKILDGHLLHIDDNHDFLMISLLMRYTDDARLRSVFAMGLDHHWQDEKAERNPFFNFVYGVCTGEHCNIEDAIDDLMGYPMDQVQWTLYNSWHELNWDMRPVELGMIPQLFDPLPAHERRITHSDSNRFIADSGIAGEAERLFTKSDDPTAFTMFPGTGDDHGTSLMACTNFTHAYWYARYHGLIEEAE